MQNRLKVVRDQRGVALPLALVGLVIVSVLVTAALVSSSTEIAVAGAQENATKGIYAAEEGLNTYVGTIASALAANNMVAPTAPAGNVALLSGGTAKVTMTQLYRREPTTAADGTTPIDGVAVYCLTSTAVRAGGQSSRMVGAYLETALRAGNLDLNINGAGSFGGQVEVSGNSTIVGQAQNVSLCGTSGAVPAIEVSAEGSVETKGGAKLVGDTAKTRETKEQFQRRILGGYTPEEIAKRANIQFGPKLTTLRNFPNKFVASADVPKDSVRNWGCHRTETRLCQGTYQDTSYYPIIGIDAQGADVDLQGDYGQGMLVVVNGGLKISGNFHFKGIIIVEGALDITGTVNVTGSVIGFNTVTVGKDNKNDLSGTMNVTFDPCVNRRVEQGFNNANPRFALEKPVYGWFEVVR